MPGKLELTGAKGVRNCYVTDLDHRPIRTDIEVGGDELSIGLPEGPVAVHVYLKVPGFGRVWATADNGGAGYDEEAALPLVEQLAVSRIRRCERRMLELDLEEPPDENFEAAWDLYELGRPLESLQQGIVAGEEIELAAAQFVLETADLRTRPSPLIASTLFGERKDGCSIGVGLDWDGDGPSPDFLHGREVWELLASVCSGTTVPTFWRWIEFSRGQQNWAPIEEILSFCEARGLAAKSFSIFWGGIGGMPPWFRDLPYPEKLQAIERWATDVVQRLKGRVSCWEVANEMHDWHFANRIPQLTHDQALEITRLVSDVVGGLDPGTPRLVNHCCPWGDYVQDPEKGGPWSPLTFLEELVETDLEFEGLGVQMYNPGRDLMECIALLDRFAEFGKPIWITEMGTPSSGAGHDQLETEQVDTDIGWRGPWEQESQADWIEKFFTMALSRDYLRSITYWDFDDRSAFIPHAGLLDMYGEPKESFFRLQELCEDLGIGAWEEV